MNRVEKVAFLNSLLKGNGKVIDLVVTDNFFIKVDDMYIGEYIFNEKQFEDVVKSLARKGLAPQLIIMDNCNEALIAAKRNIPFFKK